MTLLVNEIYTINNTPSNNDKWKLTSIIIKYYTHTLKKKNHADKDSWISNAFIMSNNLKVIKPNRKIVKLETRFPVNICCLSKYTGTKTNNINTRSKNINLIVIVFQDLLSPFTNFLIYMWVESNKN